MSLLSTTILSGDYLQGVSSADAATLATLGRALARVEGFTAKTLGYPGDIPTLGVGSYTFRLTGRKTDSRVLVLPVAPIVEIVSVHQDSDMVFGDNTLVSASDYEIETLSNGAYLHFLPRANQEWLLTNRSIKIVLTAGYADEEAIPPSLADAMYRWVAAWWLRRTNRHLNSESKGQSSQSLVPLEACPPDVAALLAPYRLLGSWGVS